MTDEAFAEIFKDMQRSQETRDRVFASLLGETRLLNEHIAKQTEKISEQVAFTAQQVAMVAQILERVVQTTDRTERMTAEVLTRLASRQDPAQ